MTTTTRFLRRDPAQVQPWAETCGEIRCLIEEKDHAAAEVHHVRIQDAVVLGKPAQDRRGPRHCDREVPGHLGWEPPGASRLGRPARDG